MIRPDSLRTLSTSEEAQCGVAEIFLDQKLSEVWQPGLSVRIPVDPEWSLRVIGALIKSYRAHGWKVEHTTVNTGSEHLPVPVRVLAFEAAS
jgi:hypothetical protein